MSFFLVFMDCSGTQRCPTAILYRNYFNRSNPKKPKKQKTQNKKLETKKPKTKKTKHPSQNKHGSNSPRNLWHGSFGH